MDHAGDVEYRRRVLYLMEECGCRPIKAEEKRIMIHNFALLQQFSRPGAKGSTFSRSPEIPRCEEACAVCQQRDFIELRHKLNLFGTPAPTGERAMGGDAIDVPIDPTKCG